VGFRILYCLQLDSSLVLDRRVYSMLREFSPYDHFKKVFEVSVLVFSDPN
jgi:hypothetical protein